MIYTNSFARGLAWGIACNSIIVDACLYRNLIILQCWYTFKLVLLCLRILLRQDIRVQVSVGICAAMCLNICSSNFVSVYSIY